MNLQLLLNHKEGITIGFIAFLIFGAVVKYVPGWIINWCISKVDQAFAKGDDADDRLLLAFIKWINEKFAPKTEGDVTWPNRMSDAAMKVIAFVPVLPVRLFLMGHADKIKELCIKLYDLGIAAAKREIAEHGDPPAQPPAVPPVVNP